MGKQRVNDENKRKKFKGRTYCQGTDCMNSKDRNQVLCKECKKVANKKYRQNKQREKVAEQHAFQVCKICKKRPRVSFVLWGEESYCLDCLEGLIKKARKLDEFEEIPF